MSLDNWPDGVDRKVYTTLDSTNAEGARIAPSLGAPTWLLALDQTAARGRRGRPWVNPAGNLAASLVLRPAEPVAQWALRSFVAALALADTLAHLTGQGRRGITLKWPNDVLLNSGKLAGILLESGSRHLVIGIGVNLVAAPAPDAVEPESTRPTSLLAETGLRIAPEDFLTPLAAAFAAREAQFTTFGFAPIRGAWLDRAARLGQPIRARTGTDEIQGTFRDMDEAGNLIVETAQGRRAIPAADIFF